MSLVSVAIVDSCPLFLSGLQGLFKSIERFNVIAQGSSMIEAVDLARHHNPDVMVLDLMAPDDLVEAVQQIRRLGGVTKVVILGASRDAGLAARVLEAGASGYVLKQCPAHELMEAVSAAIRGETFIDQTMAAQIIAGLRAAAARKIAAKGIGLNVREHQIVQGLTLGLTNRGIARRLSISEKTVKHYMTILMQKMNARNRLEVVIAAQKMGTFPAGNADAA